MDIEERVARLESLVWFEKGRSEVLERALVAFLADLQVRSPGAIDQILQKPDLSGIKELSPERLKSFTEGVNDTIGALRQIFTGSDTQHIDSIQGLRKPE